MIQLLSTSFANYTYVSLTTLRKYYESEGRRVKSEDVGKRKEIPLRASKDVFIDIRLFYVVYLLSAASHSTTFAISLCTILCLFLVSIRETNNAFEAPDEAKRFKRSGFEKENFTQSIIALQHQSSLSYLIS